ncbi:MAG: rhomboid family intramembrane serine protease [Kiloniellales bacterium]
MIPLHDDNPTTLTPVITIGLIVVCALVFLWQVTLPPGAGEAAVYAYGLIPAVLFGERTLPPEIARIPAELSVLTSMFLHGGWLHLIGNMLYLWIFGNNIEDAMGHARFVVFYVICGIAAAFAQALQDPGSTVPMIGASGAIGGVLGGYLLLYPRARVLVLVPFGFFMHMIRIPAVIVLGFWFVLQFLESALAGDQAGGVAYWAHIGGFVAGMVLVIPLRKKSFPLFGGPRPAVVPPPPGRGGRSPWNQLPRSGRDRSRGPRH